MAATYTSKEIAEKLETEQKRLRRFLRSEDSPVKPVGKGNRYSIQGGELRTLKKKFIAWQSAHTRHSSAA